MKSKKLRAMLGVKGILCIASLTVVALALVSYTARLTITPIPQFTLGATTDDWEVFVNEVDEVRYMPGDPGSPKGSEVPATQPPDTGDPNTFAFYVTTDASKKCAVKIELTAPVNSTANFTTFEIRVLHWEELPTGWQSEQLYTDETGTTTKDFINGLISGDVGYIIQDVSGELYYLIHVTYTYVDDATADIFVDFNYTPLPLPP